MSYSSSDIRIERSIYFFYWLFKFARSVVVKSRSAFYLYRRNQEWEKQIEEGNKDLLMKAFFDFNIDEYFQADSYISYINNKVEISYQNGSSGLQSVLPMIMVMDYALQNESFDAFVVEEPEQNLFPENQR